MTSDPSFLPFEIPELRSQNMRIGKESHVRRSFSTDPDEYFRMYQGDTLRLEVEFPQEKPETEVVISTNIDCRQESWQELPFSRVTGGLFRLTYPVRCCGSYKFKLKYSFDRGQTWYWDRVPFSHVIVDPEVLRDIRMYTLIPMVSGTIGEWTEMLPRIAGLGFNAVHLLPITRLDYSQSPYAAHDLFSIDEAYHGIDAPPGFGLLETFIGRARELGIRLCFDLVLNHIGIRSKMAQRCPEWIVPDSSEKDGLKRAGCWHMNSWLKWGDLVKIYYDHPHTTIRHDIWHYMKQYTLFWAHFAHLTGGMIRLDNLHSSHEGFITELLAELRGAYPNLMIMGEFFTDSNTILKRAAEGQINLFLANQWEYPYAQNLRNYIRYLHEIGPKIRYYLPITTHDTGVPAQLFGKAEAVVPRYAITALMGTGQTGIVQGVEDGYPEKIPFIGTGRKYCFPEHPFIADRIRRINGIMGESALFHHHGNMEFVDGNHGAVLGAWRSSGQDGREAYLILANLDIKNGYALHIDLSPFLPGSRTITMEDRLSCGRIEAPANDMRISLEPCGIRVLRRVC